MSKRSGTYLGGSSIVNRDGSFGSHDDAASERKPDTDERRRVSQAGRDMMMTGQPSLVVWAKPGKTGLIKANPKSRGKRRPKK